MLRQMVRICVWTIDIKMIKHLKQNFAPILFAAAIVIFSFFPLWSHFSQDNELKNQAQKIDSIVIRSGDDLLVGASTLFAQNASVQGSLEILGTYASVSGNLIFFGEIKPDNDTCSNNQILKRTGANDWDCAADATGSVSSNSINFDEFQNPLVLDTNITTTSGSFNWAWGATSLINVGTTSFSKWINVGGVAGVRIDGDGDGAITFLGLGDGNDEDLTLNLDDTANTGVWSSTTGLNKLDFGAIGLELNQDVNLTLGANTLDHDGTTFAFNDDIVSSGTASSSFGGSLDITKGLHALNQLTVTGSASFFGGLVGSGLTSCSGNGNALNWFSANAKFGCKTLADADIPDTISLISGTIGANNISGTQTTTGTLTFGDNGDNIVFDSNTWDITGAGVGSGFTGFTTTGNFSGATASLSGNFQTSSRIISGTASHSFGGTIEGLTDNTLSFGTTAKKIKRIVANTVHALVQLLVPAATGGSATGTVAGSLGVDTASRSLNFGDGTNENVIDPRKCIAGSMRGSNLTALDQFTIFTPDNPFTISLVQVTASGTNSLGWNLTTNSLTVPVTNVFTANKSASGSGVVKYTAFANAAVGDGSKLDFRVASASATLNSVYVRVCGYMDP